MLYGSGPSVFETIILLLIVSFLGHMFWEFLFWVFSFVHITIGV